MSRISSRDLNVRSSASRTSKNGTHALPGTRPLRIPARGSGASPAHLGLGRASTKVSAASSPTHRARTSSLPSTRSGLSVAWNDDGGVEAAAFEASSYHLAQASAAAAIGTAGRVVSTGAPSSFSHARIPPSRSATASWPKTLNIHQPRAALKRPAPSYTTT